MPEFMEHITNHYVGLALQRLLPHHRVDAERAPRAGDRGKKPDIDIRHGDTRIVLEGKRDNKKWAARDAASRFGALNPKPAVVGALSYSPEFSDDNAPEAIRAGATFEFAFANSDAPDSWDGAWREGTVYDLAQAIRHPGDMGVGVRDEVADVVQKIRTGLNNFVAYYNTTAAAARKDILRAMGSGDDDSESALERAGLIVTNALMFYAALRRSEVRNIHNGEIFHPRPVSGKQPAEIRSAWAEVRKCVNYGAILELAEKIVGESEMTGEMLEEMQSCAEAALPMAQSGVDILGRIFHEVLENAKPMAAFYTTLPASAMMSEIALDKGGWEDEGVDWADPESVGKLRVCDPACGSGTLASALAWKIRDNHLRAALSKEGWHVPNNDKLRELQKALVQDVMSGYDISRAAVHMTATALGLISPEVDFRQSRVYAVRLGLTPWGRARLGSLDYLDPDFNPLDGAGEHATEDEERAQPPKEIDLCAMNPPFVSGRKGNEIFSHVREKDAQLKTQAAFRKLGKKFGFHPGRGLGPAFVSLGARLVKPGGRLAMILPSTLAMGGGKEWTAARKTIEDNFNLKTIIVSKDPVRPAFSDSANMSECMAFARKLKEGEAPSDDPALFVWLHDSPDKRETALAASREILNAANGGKAHGDLVVGNKTIGKFARMPYRGQGAWFGVNFADARLAWAANEFAANGKLSPYADGVVPMIPLGDAATFGSHRTRNYILEGKLEMSGVRRYPIYYAKCQQEKGGPAHTDNAYLRESPLAWVMPTPGNDQWITDYYKAAGRLIISASFRFDSSRRVATLTTEPVQCVDYWPVKLTGETENRLKAMTLWMSSSPSILMTARTAVVTSGSWAKMGQGCLKQLPVLDMAKIGEERVDALAVCYDEFVASGAKLGRFRDIAGDGVRAELDSRIARILDLGDVLGNLQPLRDAMGNEPVITNRQVGAV